MRAMLLQVDGADGTICEMLAKFAQSAAFELAEWDNASRKLPSLPQLKEFLELAAAARIQFPERMERLELLFSEKMVVRLVDM